MSGTNGKDTLLQKSEAHAQISWSAKTTETHLPQRQGPLAAMVAVKEGEVQRIGAVEGVKEEEEPVQVEAAGIPSLPPAPSPAEIS